MSSPLTPLQLATESLLIPSELDQESLTHLLDDLKRGRVDYADLYFQHSQQESWGLEEGLIKTCHTSWDRGVGVRANIGDKTGFAYSDDLQFSTLRQAARAAQSIAYHGQSLSPAVSGRILPVTAYYYPDNPLTGFSSTEKVAWLTRLDQLARDSDPRIKQVSINLHGSYKIILIMATDGTLQADVQPLVRLNVSVIAESKGRREQGGSGGGARTDYGYFFDQQRAETYVQEAVKRALTHLEAIDAPAGEWPVVLGAGWPGVLLHEAVGHGLEADGNRKGTSAFAGRLGQKVASPLCTVVDNGTLTQRRGSLNIDDEGTPTQCTTLIENGILTAYMQDKLNARLMGTISTGNGRRQSYAHPPLPRMTNTYLLAGQTPPEDIIASVNKGLYAVNFGGGQVDTVSGKFVFSATEAYLIENGRITAPVKGATLIGNGLETLNRISMVGNDLALDGGVGTCGKEGQQIPVGVGQPTLRIDQLTIGGTRT
ncbi:metalloprotease TldD [Thioflexithrix psekupsensis]|uniref:Metalloprotease TldD n=1 Tax=Thioflexithrix psekupsensis TaxID=1570016 RepID=A0A251X6Q2_9GAMM|nr:metalloprotease TldD [Thioflexithrix psekupsensis]OUD12607.1 metalloprotease TldD [Thioflexithrix psekupsensis]